MKGEKKNDDKITTLIIKHISCRMTGVVGWECFRKRWGNSVRYERVVIDNETVGDPYITVKAIANTKSKCARRVI